MGLLALSAFVHVWMLGERALHHDETLHGTYSWFIYVGRGYIHDPLLHGPLLYHLGALTFALFGDNDLTARLSGAVFGTLLTVMPFLIRREIGRIAAFAASVYLLISPVFCMSGGFFAMIFTRSSFELLVVVAVVRFAADRRPLWLFVGGGCVCADVRQSRDELPVSVDDWHAPADADAVARVSARCRYH